MLNKACDILHLNDEEVFSMAHAYCKESQDSQRDYLTYLLDGIIPEYVLDYCKVIIDSDK